MGKKLAILHFSAPPVVGGVESVMGHHSRLMAAAGHEVTIIAGRGAAVDERIRFLPLPLADSLHPEVLKAKEQLDLGRVPPGFDHRVDAVRDKLQEAVQGIEIVIAHNVCSLHKNLALTAALRQVCAGPGSPRLICWHHDLAAMVPRYQGEMHPGWPWDLLRQEWPAVRPRHVAVSAMRQRELSRLLALPPADIAVIPSGLDIDQFLRLAPQTSDLNQRLSLYQAAPLLLLPVRLTRRKNIELALRTMAELRASYPGARLVVTGPVGPHNPSNHDYFRELLSLRAELGIEGMVHFLAELADGYIPDVVISDLYRLADALFFPSREEGFGIPILEAGLAGIPVFCSDIPPFREIAAGQATFFSPDSLPRQLARLIEEHLAGDDAYHLRQKVRQEYAWDSIYSAKIAPLLEYKNG